MNKGNSRFSDYKGSGGRTNHSEHNSDNSNLVKTISKDRLEHANKGEYTEHNRPKSGGHGGHGQASIDYMERNNIPYEITKEYNNGVRVGNLPTSTNKIFQTGDNHTWFPKTWTAEDIANAANYVLSTHKGARIPRTSCSAVYNGVRVAITFGEGGTISTTFPSKDQGGL